MNNENDTGNEYDTNIQETLIVHVPQQNVTTNKKNPARRPPLHLLQFQAKNHLTKL